MKIGFNDMYVMFNTFSSLGGGILKKFVTQSKFHIKQKLNNLKYYWQMELQCVKYSSCLSKE